MKQLFEVPCGKCGTKQLLPTGDTCTHCGHPLGLLARLTSLIVDDAGNPQIAHHRALSDAEAKELSSNPWAVFGEGSPRRIYLPASPNVKVS